MTQLALDRTRYSVRLCSHKMGEGAPAKRRENAVCKQTASSFLHNREARQPHSGHQTKLSGLPTTSQKTKRLPTGRLREASQEGTIRRQAGFSSQKAGKAFRQASQK
eukprot:3049191-Pyramimonas_sp.AAC.1